MAQLSALKDWVRGTALHNAVRAKDCVKELRLPQVNIAHVRRKLVCPPESLRVAIKHRARASSQVVVKTDNPRLYTERLVSALQLPLDLSEFLIQDTNYVVGLFRDELGYDTVNAKLEIINFTPCSKFHADTVGVRCLCTYTGPGTMYIENRYVKRNWDLLNNHAAVGVVQEDKALTAGEGDLLFLKGNAFLGNAGMGAVHRSPDLLDASEPRLLLTVDDALPDCSCAHCN